MHLLVTVKCGQRESRFRIPCGNGQKTFKWLGLVSAARYSSESPKGSLRMRESRQAQAAGTALIPSNITTSDTSFFHPEALLGEQLEDGAEVCVALAPRVAVDAAGHPKTSRWSTIAFELSDPRKPFREQAMRDEYSAQEAKRTALEAMEADKRRGTMARKGSRLREVIKSQLPDRNAVHEAMHEDWFAMGKHRVLEALVADKQEQQKAHYVQLDELFKTYAASGSSIATAQEIEFNEFTEFVHNANLVAEGPGSQQVMHSCYNEANGDFSGGGRKSRGGPNRKVSAVASFHETKHIERPAFFNALLWFALFWAGHPDGQPDPLSRPGSSASGKPSSGNSTAYLAKFEKITNASRQLLQLLEEKILPLVHKRLPGALGKIALDQDDVLSLFYDAEEDLRGIFRARANTSDDEITITEFVSVVDDAGLIGRGGAAAASAGVSRAASRSMAKRRRPSTWWRARPRSATGTPRGTPLPLPS
ncbi:hypothetical protein SO694_00026162 [Aureococcus anophagefferens]|uniref:Uncharacterized protein n=1 Tax=Aureococcus anophagefferens TaxID=44056 RepID=A0ABR1FUT5_AURAN